MPANQQNLFEEILINNKNYLKAIFLCVTD